MLVNPVNSARIYRLKRAITIDLIAVTAFALPAVKETTALTKRKGRSKTTGAMPATGESGCSHSLLFDFSTVLQVN